MHNLWDVNRQIVIIIVAVIIIIVIVIVIVRGGARTNRKSYIYSKNRNYQEYVTKNKLI